MILKDPAFSYNTSTDDTVEIHNSEPLLAGLKNLEKIELLIIVESFEARKQNSSYWEIALEMMKTKCHTAHCLLSP